MADSNMTIADPVIPVIQGSKTRLRRVTFTHTAAGTAAGNATTTFPITGRLLRMITTGGDATWSVILNDGTANIFTKANLDATAASIPLYMCEGGDAVTDDETSIVLGIPMVNQTLKCSTAAVTTTAPTITIVYEVSDTV